MSIFPASFPLQISVRLNLSNHAEEIPDFYFINGLKKKFNSLY